MLLLSASAQATVYKYVDKDGNVTFTNVPIRGAQAIRLNPLSPILANTRKTMPPATAAAGTATPSPPATTPASIPAPRNSGTPAAARSWNRSWPMSRRR
ncbi:DUF4124 domain-containing protein [Chromobacterium haemolyticum]|nr:DUF4124 domain-containing protein [Chromobacterium haemolyticum]